MKSVLFGSLALVAMTVSAAAQYGEAVEPRYNRRGDAVCPSNYVIRGGACVSIYAGRRGEYGRRGGYDEDRGYRGGGNRGYSRGGGIEPQVNRRGELQCPSNYVIRRGLCVSLY